MTPDADRHAAPGPPAAGTSTPGGRAKPCNPDLDFGHHYRRSPDGTRVWVCRGCERRVPFNTDGTT
jgi:hypothetical protein